MPQTKKKLNRCPERSKFASKSHQFWGPPTMTTENSIFSTLLFLHLYYFAKPNENSDPVLNMIHFQKRNKIALFVSQMGFTNEKISYAKHKQTNTKNNLSHYIFLKRKTQNKQTNKHQYIIAKSKHQNIFLLETSPFSRS